MMIKIILTIGFVISFLNIIVSIICKSIRIFDIMLTLFLAYAFYRIVINIKYETKSKSKK